MKPSDAVMFFGEERIPAPAPTSTCCACARAANPTSMQTNVVETNLLNPAPLVGVDLSATIQTDNRVRAHSGAARSHATQCNRMQLQFQSGPIVYPIEAPRWTMLPEVNTSVLFKT